MEKKKGKKRKKSTHTQKSPTAKNKQAIKQNQAKMVPATSRVALSCLSCHESFALFENVITCLDSLPILLQIFHLFC